MSMSIVARRMRNRHVVRRTRNRELFHAGGRITLQTDNGDKFTATLSDPDGRLVDTTFSATPEGALRLLGVIPPRILYAPGDEGSW